MDEQFRDEALAAAEAESAGADGFLPFPFESLLLEQRLAACPRSRSGTPAARTPTPDAAPVAPPLEPATADPATPETRGWDDFRTQVHELRDQLETLDYYQLLKIPAGATVAEVKDAYFRCSVELHPDRFMLLPDAELRADIYEVYKRISEAFKVLINPEIRGRYDAMLAGNDGPRTLRYLEHPRPQLSDGEDPTADASTPAAKRYLRYANLAEAEGNLRSARMYLTLALQCEPHSTPLRSRLDAVTRRLE
jgi:DnaJ-domain-containing protein 1